MKKFLVFLTVVVMICLTAFVMYWELIRADVFPVFIESMSHGAVVVEDYEKNGTDDSYRVVVKNGGSVTLAISPEITDSTYYVLDKLIVNGENVTDQVSMMKYTTKVKEKLTVLAYFKTADRPANSEVKSSLVMPGGRVKQPNAENKYLGSVGAYGMEDVCIIYDKKTEYFYAFASGNKVSRSKDCVNWESLGCYFKPRTDVDADESIMDFSQFKSVYDWSLEHGYSNDLGLSTSQESRVPVTPEVTKIGDVYHLYFAIRKNSKLNEAAIFCVKTTDLEKSILTHEWTDVGMVINTCANTNENGNTQYDAACAVSPSIFYGKDNLFYMAYGASYGRDGEINGSVNLIELDKTGLSKQDSAINLSGKIVGNLHGKGTCYSGKVIAAPGRAPALSKNEKNLITGVDVTYDAEKGYYYMFLTYGVKGVNEQIRVVRAENAAGPYVDYRGRNADGSQSKYDMLDIGLKLCGGYTFTSSYTGGVESNDLGRASTGGVEIVKLGSGWHLAMHSSAFYTDENGNLTAGGEGAAKPAMEMRKVLWTEDGWPLVSCEGFAGEKIQDVPETEMYGMWDVLVFNRRAGENNVNEIENNKSFKMMICSGVAITEKNMKDGAKLSALSCVYNGGNTYTIKIDGVEYTVSAIVAYDRELDLNCVTFTGVADDGTTVWAKKSISNNTGLYTDVYDYAIKRAPAKLQKAYEEKFAQLGENPTQSDINTLAASLIEEVLK